MPDIEVELKESLILISEYLLQDDYAKAMEAVEHGVEVARQHVDQKWYFLFQMHRAMLELDPGKALNHFKKANPKDDGGLVDSLLFSGSAKAVFQQTGPSDNLCVNRLEHAIRLCPPDELDLLWAMWHQLGTFYDYMGQRDSAAAAYEQALRLLRGKPKTSATYSNLGIVQFEVGRFAEAKKSFEVARGLDPKNKYGFDENNAAFLSIFLVRELRDLLTDAQEKKLKAEALKLLEDAVQRKPANPSLHYNLGLLYWMLNRRKEAAEHFEIAALYTAKYEDLPFEALAGSLTSYLMAGLVRFEHSYAVKERMPDSDARLGSERLAIASAAREFLREVSYDLQLYIPSQLTALASHRQALSRERTIDQSDTSNRLVVLRRWNSYTPFVPLPPERRGKGGGYFFCWEGTGIVVDPGFDFIDNLFLNGLSLADIDVVVVTHAHLDHTMDLDPLLTLLHQRSVLPNVDQRPLTLMVNVGCSMKEFTWLASMSPNIVDTVQVLYPGRRDIFVSERITLTTTHAYHDEIITKQRCIGLVFTLADKAGNPSCRLGFTSDTRWRRSLVSDYSNCDILLAHVGSVDFREVASLARIGISEDQYRVIRGTHSETSTRKPVLTDNLARDLGFKSLSSFKQLLVRRQFRESEVHRRQHLGFTGTYKLAKGSNARLVLLSEFGEEMGSFRAKTAKSLNTALDRLAELSGADKVYPRCMTADIGMAVSLPEGKVWCEICQNFRPSRQMKEICLMHDDKRIAYYCESHDPGELGLRFGVVI